MQINNNTLYQFEVFPHRFKQNDHRLVVLVKATFDFNQDGTFELSDPQQEVNHGDELENTDNGPLLILEADVAPFKPRADIIVIAKAYVPQGGQSSYADVGVRVGKLQRNLRVFGDRHWQKSSIIGEIEKSQTQQFSQLPISYTLAYGGLDVVGNGLLENPLGRGFISDQAKKSIEGVALPNIEDPNHLIEVWHDRPTPVGFGPINKGWQPRLSYLGKYDEQWQRERAPDLAEDFSYLFYNCAHPNMQLEDYLRGDEEIELLNLTPSGKESFSLPNLNPTARIQLIEQTEAIAVPLNLDTLCILAEQRQFFMLWRGHCAIKDLTAQEIEVVNIGL